LNEDVVALWAEEGGSVVRAAAVFSGASEVLDAKWGRGGGGGAQTAAGKGEADMVRASKAGLKAGVHAATTGALHGDYTVSKTGASGSLTAENKPRTFRGKTKMFLQKHTSSPEDAAIIQMKVFTNWRTLSHSRCVQAAICRYLKRKQIHTVS
jgi:hypothetical protein